jgi:tetratricopeptide (TPR) repeat protein
MAMKFSLAWVGSITAVFSLVGGVYGGWEFFSGQIERRHAIDGLLKDEAVQINASDYESAWKTLGQAAGIDPKSERVEQSQEDAAMLWLENISTSGDQTFASITEKIEPVLISGAATAKSPQRQADLMAHLGWSYFLRNRESGGGPDPESAYREALRKDPDNPYAHVMWGHWILWNRGNENEASRHFVAALAASRPVPRSYLRSMELSAYNNDGTPAAHFEMIRIANDIRKENGEMDADWAHELLNVYWEYVAIPNEYRKEFLSAIPPQDHLATFDWLVEREGGQDSGTHAYIRSALLEAAGRKDEALASYRALAHTFRPNDAGSLVDGTRKAIARLTSR